jgi:predicted DNA-binding transcriptional regulator AlpA
MAFDISKDGLMGIDEICQKLGVTKRTFRRMRSKENIVYLDTSNRVFPEPVCYLVGGKSPKWSVRDINHWINTIAKPLQRDSSGAWVKSETADNSLSREDGGHGE